MKPKTLFSLALMTIAVSGTGPLTRAAEPKAGGETTYFGIPFKPDPPPSIDGRLDEWATVPNAWTPNTKEHAVYGGNLWKSPQDLSAKVWLAWRNDHLYLAADVTDDQIRQKGQGGDMWQGDHITIYIDATPDFEPERETRGVGQMQFGFSPGNLAKTGDPLTDKVPEAFTFRPQGATAEGILVAAQKTPTGYSLEAAMPWALITKLAGRAIGTPAVALPLAIEVGISDTDGEEAKQEKMITLSTAEWHHGRSRSAPMVLAPASGVAPPVVRAVPVFETLELGSDEKKEMSFNTSAVPEGKEAILLLKARLDHPVVAGYNYPMELVLNGVRLDGKRLRNRTPVVEMMDGRFVSSFTHRFTVVLGPDFESPNKHPYYGLKLSKTTDFEIAVTDLIKKGANTLVVDNLLTEDKYKLMLAEGRLEFRAPFVPRVRRKAPTGPLSTVQPVATHKVRYSLTPQRDNNFMLQVGDAKFRVTSQFSTPDGVWASGDNKYYSIKREIVKQDEAILVRDTLTNLTGENVPIMMQHRAELASGALEKIWLGGLSPAMRTATSSTPGNPTSFGTTKKAGVGLLALDDVFQVHTTNFSSENTLGLADNQFVLKPKTSHIAEWAILPTATPNYYDFLNAFRRLRKVNFPIEGSHAFLRADPNQVTGKWTDEQVTNFIRFKNAKLLNHSYTYPSYKGYFPHGTAFQTLDWTYLKAQIARLKKLVPEAKHLTYFHVFLDVLDDADKKYADARVLRSDGTQVDYGVAVMKQFLPTETNGFGRDIAKNLDLILAPQPQGLGCDGVYWDEFEYSATVWHYDDFASGKTGLPWDGVSADIDPKTMKIARLKSSVTLLSQPFRLSLVKRILSEGRPLVANGAPHTRTMVDQHFPRFVETGSISNCATAQTYTPIALGDHLTERNEVDAYHHMLRALDYGCLYYWYTDIDGDMVMMPTHHHLTSFMFPLTPVELHEGTIIGRERIITKNSGLFGWGDNAKHEVHVFDEEGKEVKDFKAPLVKKNGKTYTELRLAEDWSAAIVRR